MRTQSERQTTSICVLYYVFAASRMETASEREGERRERERGHAHTHNKGVSNVLVVLARRGQVTFPHSMISIVSVCYGYSINCALRDVWKLKRVCVYVFLCLFVSFVE